MLAAGILGFFALSGDFGGSNVDEPAPDGWRQRAETNGGPDVDLGQPQFAPQPSITVNREPIAAPPQAPSLSDPAEGEVVQTNPSPPSQGTPDFMGAPGATASSNSPGQAPAAIHDSAHQASMTRPTSLEAAERQSASSQNGPGESAPPSSYPSTGAAGLSPMTQPLAGNPGAYPVTRTEAQPGPSVAGIAAPSPPPAFPSSSAYPSTGYPTTGAAAPFTNPTPSAMNPRYERIR
jgi:hypothetical protein